MSGPARLLRSSAHVGVLWTLAVAQPLLDVLGRAPEFFVAHRAGAAEIVALAALLVLVPWLLTAALLEAAALLGDRIRDGLAAALIGLLGGVLAAQIGYRAGITEWTGTLVTAVPVGAAAGTVWLTSRAFGSFLTVLSPAILVVPAVFLLGPGIRSLVWPSGAAAAASGRAAAPVPVVLLIFDELPLASLVDAEDRLDAVRYPNIAALAADGIWFRNATAVSDFTPWAVPAILTGSYPDADAVATLGDHPENLFTLLGPTHRFEVVEQRSSLCPEELCRGALPRRGLPGMLPDLRIVSGHVLLPPAARGTLPDVTQDWAGFDEGSAPAEPAWGFDQAGSAVRFRAFLAGIEAGDPQPTLYFIHSLVSHHAGRWVPSGQTIAGLKEIPGLGDRWTRAAWPVAQYYQRHLWQAGLVDTLMGELADRLRDAGFYEPALIVITADHGLSFQPRAYRRHFREETAGEILPVPLIVKLPAGAPGPAPGTIDDRNVQTIDVLPTIADVLDVGVPWPMDGRSVLDDRPREPTKVFYHHRARWTRRLDVAHVEALRRAAVARKLAIFGTDRWPAAQIPELRHLVGRSVAELPIARQPGPWRVLLDDPAILDTVDPDGPAVPGEVSGTIERPSRDAEVPNRLAVALNGIVVATTETWPGQTGWLAPLPPDRLRPGRNELDIFLVDPASPDRLLRPRERPASLELALGPSEPWGIRRAGLHGRESARGRPFRWTNGDAGISLPLDSAGTPESLTIEVLFTGRAGKRLQVEVNDCPVLETTLPAGRWSQTVPVGTCPPQAGRLRIRLSSEVHVPDGRDRRRLGVALAGLTLH